MSADANSYGVTTTPRRRRPQRGLRRRFTGDATRVKAEAHGVTRNAVVIGVAIDGAGIGANAVQARDDLVVVGHDLHLVVDEHATQGAVGAAVLLAAIEGALLERLHKLALFLKDVVPAVVAHLVVLVDVGEQALHVDTRLLGKLLQRVGLADCRVAGLQGRGSTAPQSRRTGRADGRG